MNSSGRQSKQPSPVLQMTAPASDKDCAVRLDATGVSNAWANRAVDAPKLRQIVADSGLGLELGMDEGEAVSHWLTPLQSTEGYAQKPRLLFGHEWSPIPAAAVLCVVRAAFYAGEHPSIQMQCAILVRRQAPTLITNHHFDDSRTSFDKRRLRIMVRRPEYGYCRCWCNTSCG